MVQVFIAVEDLDVMRRFCKMTTRKTELREYRVTTLVSISPTFYALRSQMHKIRSVFVLLGPMCANGARKMFYKQLF